MILRRAKVIALAALVAGALVGCYQSQKSLHYIGDASLQYYKDVATKVDYPVNEESSTSIALATAAPRRIRDIRKDPLWDMSLAEAIQIALQNAAIIRERDQFLSPRNPLMTNPDGVTTLYDPAIQETEVRFGNRGVEAALADFDAQFTSSMIWGRNEQVQNNLFNSGGLEPGETLKEETAVFQSRLQKQFADSGSFAVSHDWNYSLNNVPTRLFGSVYEGNLRAEYRRPLWARSGTEFTRIAGANATTTSGVNQGVVIARINNDISIADFELNMQNLVRDVENAYWDLSLAYRAYHSETVSNKSALNTWRDVKVKQDEGIEGGGAADEAQGRDNYFDSEVRVQTALAEIYSTEGQLRRLIGLTVNDGRVIRPTDQPTIAEYILDWQSSLVEGLTRRVELRRQKWQIKSLELQLTAAKSLTHPEFDFVSGYQVNGFGDTLIDDSDNDGLTPHGLNSAYGTLTQGDQTGWNLGFEMRMPLGFRAGHSQVRNLELRLARARKILDAQELDVSHELSSAFQSLDRWYKISETNFNRRRAAESRVQAFEVEYEEGRTTLDLLLRSQISLADAEVAFFRSVAEYNKSIAEIHYRKGSLLEHNNVHIGEGLWEGEAYTEALRRAWARSHAFDNPTLRTEPAEFVDENPAADLMMRMVPEPSGSYHLQGTQATPTASPSTFAAPRAEAAPDARMRRSAPELPTPAPQLPRQELPRIPSTPAPAPMEKSEPMAAKPTLRRVIPAAEAPPTKRAPTLAKPKSSFPIEVSEDPAVWRRVDATPIPAAETPATPARPMLPILESPVDLPTSSEPVKSSSTDLELWRQRDISETPAASIQPRMKPARPLTPEQRTAKPSVAASPAKGQLLEPAASSSAWQANDGPVIEARPAAPSVPAPGLVRAKEVPATVTDNWAPRTPTAKKKPLIAPQIQDWAIQDWAPSSSGKNVDAADFQSDLSIQPMPNAGRSSEGHLPGLPTYRWRGTVTPTAGQSTDAK